MKPKLKVVAAQPSWIVANDRVELAVTRLGGHMAPVTFCRGTPRPVQPYYVSPWQTERRRIDTPVLRPLRGDFFCMPFGGTNAWRGEDHTPHGETATRTWACRSLTRLADVTCLTLTMRTTMRPGDVAKRIQLVDGQNVVYVQHVLAGFRGPMCLGHHATLAVPQREGSLRVSTAPFRMGMTCPDLFSDPAGGEYQSLAIGAEFTDLREVPTLWKDPPTADCTSLPARKGFTDLLAVFAEPARCPAWTTAVVADEGYLWFSLKDPAVLPATVMWISNRGRHGAPWDGRNRCLGLEDVCGYFAHGLAASARPNLLNRAGIPTAVRLSPRMPTVVNYVEGVVPVPRRFGRVAGASFSPGKVTFADEAGRAVAAAVRHEFITTGAL